MEKPEGSYTFYQDDRDRIKGKSMLPTETLRYIEALEQVARAAYKSWASVNKPEVESSKRKVQDDLYDALSVVNFMDETL